jgi:hypothetical protein
MASEQVYRCGFEILAPVRPESAELVRVPGDDREYAVLTVEHVAVLGHYWVVYAKAKGRHRRFMRKDLPPRGTAAEAEADLIEYADKMHWFKRARTNDNG